MCDAAPDSPERFIAVNLHNRRVTLTLFKIPVYGREDDDVALGGVITETIRKILEGRWPNRNE